MPRIIGVQGYRLSTSYTENSTVPKKKGEESNLADGILVPNPPRTREIVEAVNKQVEK